MPAPIPKSPPPRPVKRAPVRKAPVKKKPAAGTANRTRAAPKPAASPAKKKTPTKTASPQFERGRTHEVARSKTPNAGPANATPKLTDDPARKRSLDRMQDLERRQAGVERDLADAPEPKTDAAKRDLSAKADQVDRLRDERTREGTKLYGHLMQSPPSRYGAPGDRTLPNDTGQRFVGMDPAQRDAALKNMSPGERRQVTDQLRGAEREVEKKLKGLQEHAADDDPRVIAARKELEGLRATEKKADDRYHDAYRSVRDREEGALGHRVFGSLYSDPHDIAANETRTEKRAFDDARTRVRDAERRLSELEKNAPLSAEAQEARAKLVEEKQGLEAARERVALGPASRDDAQGWLDASADARNEQLAGGLPADQAESMASHLYKMRGELEKAPPGETADAREAREAKLASIDTAAARLRDRRLSPDLFDWSQRTQQRMDELHGIRKPSAAQQKELRDLGTAMTGLGQLSPGELMNDWGHWERGHADELAQPGLQKEWEAHVAENPQALRDLDRDVAAAREQVLSRLTPEQRADFEKNFELKTRFGRDEDGALTYGVGYVPTAAMADKQIEQSLGAGLHHSQPAMEIGHHYRVQEYARPQNAAAAAQWWQQFGQAGAGDLKTHSGGGGLQPTYDEMLIIPTGSLMRAAGSTFGKAAITQFGRNAAKEIATNIAFDAAINTVGNAVSDRFGEKWGAAVPFAAVAATLLTGRVMRSPRVQGMKQRIGDRVRQALPERLGGGPRKTRVPDVNAPKTTGAPTATKRAAATPLEKPMVIDDSVRHLGVDAKDHVDLINKHGLQPKHNVTVDNVNYSMSDPFDIGHGRVAVLAVVDDGAQKTLRAFYRSNSQGNFRLLPAQNHGLGHLGLPGYDKGLGEHMLNLPSQVDETLAGLVRGNKVRSDIPVDDAGRLFAGASPINRTPADYFAYRESADFVGNGVTQRTIAPGAGKGRDARLPQDVQVPPEQMPRFDQPPVRTYKTNTSTAGDVDAMVYRSADDSLEYTLFKGDDGRVWVANVADSSSPITRHGVRQQAVDAGELDIPRWEYHQQIPQGFEGAAHPSMGNAYGDAWAYLRELPLIQSYYSAQGLPVPR